MEIKDIALWLISIGDRKRPIDPGKVKELQQSLQQQGLLQPIGVKVAGDHYRLVFGAHRLVAVQGLESWDSVSALVFPETATDEECLLAELQENLARNELTGAERKAFAAEVGRISLLLKEESNECSESTVDSTWFVDFYNNCGLSKAGAHKWWKSFCTETDRNITPRQATAEDKAAFFDWLEEAKTKAEEERKRKEAEAEAEKERKEAEALAKRKEEEREDMHRYLTETAALINDRDAVVGWLYEWIEKTQPAT